jgi:hypothetical protein
MRTTFINTILCLFIVLIGIALDSDDNVAANFDWNDFDYYPSHLLNARAAKSRFWKRAPARKFWKRSAMTNDIADSAYNQHQEKH